MGKGDIVALLMGNRPEFLESALAVNRVGAAFLPLNVRLAEPELEYIIRHAGAVAIVTEPGFAAPVAAISGRLTTPWTVVMTGDEGTPARAPPATSRSSARTAAPPSLPPMSPRRTCTGSCTARGRPRTPRGCRSPTGTSTGRRSGTSPSSASARRTARPWPGRCTTSGAFDLPGIGTWWVGGSLVILPRFDVPDLLATIERERPTNVWLAPAMVNATLNAIAQSPELGKRSTASIRFITGGGEKMPVTLIERLLAAFPNARFADAYGLTETVSGDTFNDQAHTLSKIGSVGKPVVNLDVRILGADDAPAAPGAQGEIALRGPKVVSGYWKNPEATAAAFTADGWFRTGDIGHLDDDGYLYIDDRKKDMIVSGGENVATSEVERVLYECDAVLEAAVVAMPDARWGEVPRAFVVLKPGQDDHRARR